MYQILILVGNLGHDPEMRYSPNGTPVTSFSVAMSRKFATATGKQKEETIWFRISVWGKQAETCNQYPSIGQKVLVEGQLIGDESGGPRIWSGPDGKPRTSFELRAQTVRFLSGRMGQAGEGEHGEG